MHQTRPLPDTHPEFSVIHWPGFTEYRVEHWRLARDGTGRVVRGTHVWSFVDVLAGAVAALVLFARPETPVSRPAVLVCVGITLTCLVWLRFTQVLHESILVFPTLGIQLETHRGHPLLPTLFTTHHFIPLSALEDVIIHEGFRRWDVRFYLAVLRRTHGSTSGASCGGVGRIRVCVAFENILPYFPILKDVYLGVQGTLFPSPTRVVEVEGDE